MADAFWEPTVTERSILRLAGTAVAMVLLSTPSNALPQQSDAAIKQAIIRASIAAYPGNCPCPYNSARNGSRCGARSAYSRGGGYAPMCYASDVSAEQVARYRRDH